MGATSNGGEARAIIARSKCCQRRRDYANQWFELGERIARRVSYALLLATGAKLLFDALTR